jgi:3-deoxy-D-manno-octulosonic-acid transferase
MRCRWARSMPPRRWSTRCARASGPALLVTTITPTGSERVRALWGERSSTSTCPTTCRARAPLPGALPPGAGAGDGNRTVAEPAVRLPRPRHAGLLLNARLSARSLRGYRVLRPLIARALRTVAPVAAQSPTMPPLRRLGAPRRAGRESATSSTTSPVPEARHAWPGVPHRDRRAPGLDRRQHPRGRGGAVVEMHRRLRARWPDLLLLWAPRHPERFRGAAQQAATPAGGGDPQAHALARRGRRGVRDRHAGRAAGSTPARTWPSSAAACSR